MLACCYLFSPKYDGLPLFSIFTGGDTRVSRSGNFVKALRLALSAILGSFHFTLENHRVRVAWVNHMIPSRALVLSHAYSFYPPVIYQPGTSRHT